LRVNCLNIAGFSLTNGYPGQKTNKYLSYFYDQNHKMFMKKILKTLFNRLLIVALVACLFVFSGCGDDDEGPTQTVWQIVENDSELSAFEAQLIAAGLDDELAGEGNFTLFAPTDAAMNTLLTTLGLADFSSISSDIVQEVLSYHIANQQYLTGDLTDGIEITTQQGEAITVVTGPELSTGATSDSGIEAGDIRATNGVIHKVNTVLVPPSIGGLIVQTLGTIAQPILLGSPFTTLSAGIQKADQFASDNGLPTLISTLTGDGPYTFFAPTNETFQAGQLSVDSFSGQEWYGIIGNHIGIGNYAPSALTHGTEISTAAGGNLVISAPGSGGAFTSIFINSDADAEPEAEVAQPDAAVETNGRIHVIAGLLTP
jgi:transforming growth factor-beta-induced protein